MPRRSTEKSESCPFCEGRRIYTIDSRYGADIRARRRRYHCSSCGQNFSTYEIPAAVYERLVATRVNIVEIESVIAVLRAIKVQFGESNGHRQD